MAVGTKAWAGAITLAGLPVNIELRRLVKSRSGESFRQLCPDGETPIRQIKVDPDGNEVSEPLKGVQIGSGKNATFTALTEAQLAIVEAQERSEVVEPDEFCPVSSVDLSCAVASYAVAPADVPGAESSVGILWNGLRASQLALVTRITMRAGSRDAIVVIYATDTGLRAVALPFAEERYDEPDWKPEPSAEAQELFEQFAAKHYKIREFDPSAHASQWRERRQAAIEAALKGKGKKPARVKAPAKPQVPDLLTALKASVADSASRSKPAKKAPRKKVAA